MDFKIEKLPFSKYLQSILQAFLISSALFTLAILTREIPVAWAFFTTLVTLWVVLFILWGGISAVQSCEKHIRLQEAEDIKREYALIQSESSLWYVLRSTAYLLIICLMIQYGWFMYEFPGVWFYIISTFVYIILLIELARGFIAKSKMKTVEKKLDTMISELGRIKENEIE